MGRYYTLYQKRVALLKDFQKTAEERYGDDITVEYVGNDSERITQDVPVYAAKNLDNQTIGVGITFDYKPIWFDIKRKDDDSNG